ncbi:hypothetical protein VNO77_20056 [Canavalia gladiata]|uniref:Uncharacterized protein n=1 Tax=Canavalia gladiata TaxID=3824 RepID=A0AAN9QL25_CANGL
MRCCEHLNEEINVVFELLAWCSPPRAPRRFNLHWGRGLIDSYCPLMTTWCGDDVEGKGRRGLPWLQRPCSFEAGLCSTFFLATLRRPK